MRNVRIQAIDAQGNHLVSPRIELKQNKQSFPFSAPISEFQKP